MEEKISIVVPVYNVEIYLEKCIKSILNQTYKNIEVILINDGSTDNSKFICEQLVEIDSRVRFFDINNSGVSFARNYGVEKSTGKYIIFVDSDDYVSKNMVKLLYNNMLNTNADLSIGKVKHVYSEEDIEENSINDDIKIYEWNSKEALKEFMNTKRTSFFPVAKLYKKEFFNKFKFNSNYKLAEDALFLTELLLDNEIKVVYFDYPIYFYFHRNNSATTTVNDNVFDTIKVYDEILPKIEEKYPDLKMEILNRRYWSYFIVLDKILLDKNKYVDDIKLLRKKILKGFLCILKDPNFKFTRKISLVVLLFSTKGYEFLVKLNKN